MLTICPLGTKIFGILSIVPMVSIHPVFASLFGYEKYVSVATQKSFI